MTIRARLNALEAAAGPMLKDPPCRACRAPAVRSRHHRIAPDLIGGACPTCSRLLAIDGRAFGGVGPLIVARVNEPTDSPHLVRDTDDGLRLMPDDMPVWIDALYLVSIDMPLSSPGRDLMHTHARH